MKLIICVFFFLPVTLIGQKEADEFISKISNDKLQFEIAKVGTTQLLDSNRIVLPRDLVMVTSLDVNKMVAEFGQKKVIELLLPLLQDSSKDWYANVLLYDITKRDATPLIVVDNRPSWINNNHDLDITFWRDHYGK
jgi:hypothetical protein